MSDPSESFGSFVRGGIRRLSMKKSRSETEDVNTGIENCQEVEATTLQSGKTGRISSRDAVSYKYVPNNLLST